MSASSIAAWQPRRIVPCAVLLVGFAASAVCAQDAAASKPAPFGIVDNSFLVEEAFNQDPGIVQNIVSFTRERTGDWSTVFTQEWPFPNMTHQLSYTLPLDRLNATTGVGDVLINYRFQVASETPTRPAFAPRLSVVLPTGDQRNGFGTGAFGWQVNLPFSKRAGDFYFHWNGGFTYIPRAKVGGAEGGGGVALFSPIGAGSVVWQVLPLFDVLLEVVASSDQHLTDDGTRAREHQVTVSPGFRRGWNLTEKQVVLGAALPITVTDGSSVALLVYFSYEARFKK